MPKMAKVIPAKMCVCVCAILAFDGIGEKTRRKAWLESLSIYNFAI